MYTATKEGFQEIGMDFSEAHLSIVNALCEGLSGHVVKDGMSLWRLVKIAQRNRDDVVVRWFDAVDLQEVGTLLLLFEGMKIDANWKPLRIVLSNVDQFLLQPGMKGREIKGFLKMVASFKTQAHFLIGISSEVGKNALQQRFDEIKEMKFHDEPPEFSFENLVKRALGEAI